ncbi:outer membrane protein with beta-barrel domain [Cellulophaga sp. RHA_52]|uniref:porin family protein n=1 Tax=Cellulophaga sp. RHA_52 TaxID=1250036 RepID=UPI0011995596|nr:porin family protein [Cellulophaga sp. RHA_52]TVZ08705.1 outer membrane protein with beta-barrel domain [Cellulophaga sp. RHA_52]
MKKTTFLLLAALFVYSSNAIAQKINYGAKAGLNVSNLYGNNQDKNSLVTFHAGFFTQVEISEKLNIQPELLYSRQGADLNSLYKAKLDYISIPIQFKYNVLPKFFLQAGPQVSFLVSDKAVFYDDNIGTLDTDAKSVDFGFNTGFGLNLGAGIFTEARYNFGITTVAENPDIKNGVLQISLGYIF